MIEDKELGLKVAENPREALIKEAIENTKKRVIELKLTLEMQENSILFLETLVIR